jgi:hypothetical protein
MGSSYMRFVYLVIFAAVLAVTSWGQQTMATLRGQITDESGALVPGAQITVSDSSGHIVTTVTSHDDGTYIVPNLVPGHYSVVATAPGLKQIQPKVVDAAAGAVSVNLQLVVALANQTVTVTETVAPSVSVDPENNQGALVLKQDDLKALSDDPDDLQQDLQALAGPGAGPNGAQIYIDGFTGGRLPPKESIREIRINQNPFSAEYDRLGFGRIEIFTKPGTDKLRGMLFLNDSDTIFNSRNPFLVSPGSGDVPFQTRQYGGNLSGPLSKKASFFLDFERRDIDDAVALTAFTNPLSPTTPLGTFGPTPQERTTVSPRLDYQLTSNQTLTVRYTWTLINQNDNGIGGITLPSVGTNNNQMQNTGQFVDTIVINPKTINETRAQYQHITATELPIGGDIPQIDVQGAFVGGSSTVGNYSDLQNYYELQNYTSYITGQHSIKFGVRGRSESEALYSPANFNGTFTFLSLDQCLPGGAAAPALGACAPNAMPQQLTFSRGLPLVNANMTDVSAFVNDDWRVKPNFTLSLGLRWETQNDIHDHADFAPRLGFAWAPGGGGANARPKTVFRGGFGLFYDRFNEGSYLMARELNGINQQQYIITNPGFFATTEAALQADLASLPPSALQTASTVHYEIDPNLKAPYVLQSAIGIERQLPFNSTLSVNYTNTRGVHQFLTRDINAPLPGTYNPADPDSGVRPYGNVGDIYQFESDGVMRQNQLMVNINTRLNANFTMFAGYFYNQADANTNGIGSFVANPYNLSEDYGRTSYDIHNRLFVVGSYNFRWNIRLSPFLQWNSGAPFNVTVPEDLFGTGRFNARPALTGATQADCASGSFTAPTAGEAMIPLNYCQGPSFFQLNLRLSKTWGFGKESETSGMSRNGGVGGGGRGGPGGPMRGIFGDSGTNQRYNLTLGVMARNLLNNVNYATPVGVLGPTFGQFTGIAGGYGPEGQYPVENRRVELQLRFTF